MKLLQVVTTLLFPLTILAQENFEIETDSSIVETRYYENFNYIGEFNTLKNEKKTYFKKYFYDTKRLQEECVFGEDGNRVGISKKYSSNGKLICEVDHDKGIFLTIDKKEFPFFGLQEKMKRAADSLIAEMYGEGFLKNNTVWDVDGSYIRNGNESDGWADLDKTYMLKDTPDRFLFRYDVKLDENHRYDRLIEFELDSQGKFIPNEHERIFGFEEVAGNLKGGFKLTYEEAVRKSTELGFSQKDSTQIIGDMRWENFKRRDLINGRFRFYITVSTKKIENIVPDGRSSITTKYEVYSFNPWTAEFIEKKKMKSIYSWEKSSGSSTGLIPDND